MYVSFGPSFRALCLDYFRSFGSTASTGQQLSTGQHEMGYWLLEWRGPAGWRLQEGMVKFSGSFGTLKGPECSRKVQYLFTEIDTYNLHFMLSWCSHGGRYT